MVEGKKLLHSDKLRKYSVLLLILVQLGLCFLYWHTMVNMVIRFGRTESISFVAVVLDLDRKFLVLLFYPIVLFVICFIGKKWRIGLFAALGEFIALVAYFFLYNYAVWAQCWRMFVDLSYLAVLAVIIVFFFFILFKAKILRMKKVAISLPFISLID